MPVVDEVVVGDVVVVVVDDEVVDVVLEDEVVVDEDDVVGDVVVVVDDGEGLDATVTLDGSVIATVFVSQLFARFESNGVMMAAAVTL